MLPHSEHFEGIVERLVDIETARPSGFVEQELLDDAMSGKSSCVRSGRRRWRGGGGSDFLSEQSGEYCRDWVLQVSLLGFAR